MRFKLPLFASIALLALAGCGGNSNPADELTHYTVTVSAGEGGTASPTERRVVAGARVNVTASSDVGYIVGDFAGCNGQLTDENRYQSAPVQADCQITVSFVTGPIDTVAEPQLRYNRGAKTIALEWDPVEFATSYQLYKNIDGQSGFTPLGGELGGDETRYQSVEPLYRHTQAQYQLEACNADGCETSATVTTDDTIDRAIGYFKRGESASTEGLGRSVASSGNGERLAAGSPGECRDGTGFASCSGAVSVYQQEGDDWSVHATLSPSDLEAGARFGWQVALSDDGQTLAVSAPGVEHDDGVVNLDDVGTVYFFERSEDQWQLDQTLRPDANEPVFAFGSRLALSGDGDRLAVIAKGQGSEPDRANLYHYQRGSDNWTVDTSFMGASSATLNTDGTQLALGWPPADTDTADNAGQVTLYEYTQNQWQEGPSLVAPNPFDGEGFGARVAMDGNATVLAVGVSLADTLDSDERERPNVYVYRQGPGGWAHEQTLAPAERTIADDCDSCYAGFGEGLTVNADGRWIGVGDPAEDGEGQGLLADLSTKGGESTGAVYLYQYDNNVWRDPIYLKARNAGPDDRFGTALALTRDGQTLVAGAPNEDGSAIGAETDPENESDEDDSGEDSGAVYLY